MKFKKINEGISFNGRTFDVKFFTSLSILVFGGALFGIFELLKYLFGFLNSEGERPFLQAIFQALPFLNSAFVNDMTQGKRQVTQEGFATPMSAWLYCCSRTDESSILHSIHLRRQISPSHRNNVERCGGSALPYHCAMVSGVESVCVLSLWLPTLFQKDISQAC